MAHQFQTHHLRSVAMNYLVGRFKGDFSTLEGFSELSQDIQDEFKRGSMLIFFLHDRGVRVRIKHSHRLFVTQFPAQTKVS
jgi:hypothetical protein